MRTLLMTTPKERAEQVTLVRVRTEKWICEEDAGDGNIVGWVPTVERGREPREVPGYWQQHLVVWTEYAGEVVQAETVYCEQQDTTPLGADRIEGMFARLEARVRGAIELTLYQAETVAA
jgi:hypothetical protein